MGPARENDDPTAPKATGDEQPGAAPAEAAPAVPLLAMAAAAAVLTVGLAVMIRRR